MRGICKKNRPSKTPGRFYALCTEEAAFYVTVINNYFLLLLLGFDVDWAGFLPVGLTYATP